MYIKCDESVRNYSFDSYADRSGDGRAANEIQKRVGTKLNFIFSRKTVNCTRVELEFCSADRKARGCYDNICRDVRKIKKIINHATTKNMTYAFEVDRISRRVIVYAGDGCARETR